MLNYFLCRYFLSFVRHFEFIVFWKDHVMCHVTYEAPITLKNWPNFDLFSSPIIARNITLLKPLTQALNYLSTITIPCSRNLPVYNC